IAQRIAGDVTRSRVGEALLQLRHQPDAHRRNVDRAAVVAGAPERAAAALRDVEGLWPDLRCDLRNDVADHADVCRLLITGAFSSRLRRSNPTGPDSVTCLR